MGAPRTRPPFQTQDQTVATTVTQTFGQTISTGQSGSQTNGNQ